jgi:hypothetical protein
MLMIVKLYMVIQVFDKINELDSVMIKFGVETVEEVYYLILLL